MIKRGFYSHYKGGLYVVLHVAKDTETLERRVWYYSLHFWDFWDRPASMWYDLVKMPDGSTQTRFKRVSLWYALTHLKRKKKT